MAWYAVYREADGSLESVGTSVADPLPLDLAVKEYSNKPDEGNRRWNPSKLDFESFTPDPEPVSRLAFLKRFTPQERGKIRGARSQDAMLDDFMYLLEAAGSIDPMDQDVIDGMNYLENQGYIDAGRAEEIRGV